MLNISPETLGNLGCVSAYSILVYFVGPLEVLPVSNF
jgi:hypothetical protein